MSADLTISFLAEKMDLRIALKIHFAGIALGSSITNNPACGDWESIARDAMKASEAMIAELDKQGLLPPI